MLQAIHFIAIGGSIMHSLARALQQQGFMITGSDDVINEPSRSQLQQHNLLPKELGWFPEKITNDLEAVIVGMHAKKDNPELLKALELKIPVYSYPEYIYQQSRQKQRVVITGSHGKSTITAIILHVLTYHHRTFDYLIGAESNTLKNTVRLTLDAPIIIIEGDEYSTSPIDSRPKFLHYQPHIALISGIAWDHVNIYPTWEDYVDPFELLAERMPKAGILIFDESDNMLDVIGQKERTDITKIPYEVHPSEVINNQTFLLTKRDQRVSVALFGDHNMKNIAGALTVLDRIGITETQFYEAIPSFKNITGRLERIAATEDKIIFRDFSHAPSKVEASIQAVKLQYPDKKLIAVLELNTISSLDKSFLGQYRGCMDEADVAVVYVDKQTSIQLTSVTDTDIVSAFDRSDLNVFTYVSDLDDFLDKQGSHHEIFLFISTGSLGGLNLTAYSTPSVNQSNQQ